MNRMAKILFCMGIIFIGAVYAAEPFIHPHQLVIAMRPVMTPEQAKVKWEQEQQWRRGWESVQGTSLVTGVLLLVASIVTYQASQRRHGPNSGQITRTP